MAAWFWLKGIQGPPANDGWFELLSYQIGKGTSDRVSSPPSKTLSVMVQYDSQTNQLFDAMVKGRPIEAVNIFVEPLTHYVFTECNIVSVSAAVERDRVSCNLAFETVRLG